MSKKLVAYFSASSITAKVAGLVSRPPEPETKKPDRRDRDKD